MGRGVQGLTGALALEASILRLRSLLARLVPLGGPSSAVKDSALLPTVAVAEQISTASFRIETKMTQKVVLATNRVQHSTPQATSQLKIHDLIKTALQPSV